MPKPSKYSKAMANKICMRLAGGETLKSICEDSKMPVRSTVHKWVIDKPEFAEMYTNARMLQAEYLFEETLDIADDGRNDWMERHLNNGETVEVVNSEHINRSRLRVDTRKFFISKIAPKIYGDKIEHDLTPAAAEAFSMNVQPKRD